VKNPKRVIEGIAKRSATSSGNSTWCVEFRESSMEDVPPAEPADIKEA
jgi:hypothetical protein